jgi:hypothetical protein
MTDTPRARRSPIEHERDAGDDLIARAKAAIQCEPQQSRTYEYRSLIRDMAKGIAAMQSDRADLLAALEQAQAELAARDKACAEWAEVSQSNYQRAVAAEAEAELLRGALTYIDALDPEAAANGCSDAALRGLVSRMGGIARAALTKGDSDD